jgi:hypothetical protein
MGDKTTVTVDRGTSDKIAELLPLARQVTNTSVTKSDVVKLALIEYEKVLNRKVAV